jgi:hypothetical protein
VGTSRGGPAGVTVFARGKRSGRGAPMCMHSSKWGRADRHDDNSSSARTCAAVAATAFGRAGRSRSYMHTCRHPDVTFVHPDANSTLGVTQLYNSFVPYYKAFLNYRTS